MHALKGISKMLLGRPGTNEREENGQAYIKRCLGFRHWNRFR